MFQTFGLATEVTGRTEVDTFQSRGANGSVAEGYQRDLQLPRVRKAAGYYRNRGLMPNALLGNIRRDDFDRIGIQIDGDHDGFTDAQASGGNWIGTGVVVVEEGVPIWLYDGQHRDSAIEHLLAEGVQNLRDFPTPLSLTLGRTREEEMKEFYEVNQNAKAVKTDLAWELLRKMSADDPELAELLQIRNEDWKTRGADVADALVELGGVWAHSIQEPNLRKGRKDRLTLNKAQFIRSLQPVLAMPVLRTATADDIAAILHAYWEGIARVLPEPFDHASDPKRWVIQKGPGAIALHRVLPQVVEFVRASGRRLGDAEAYAEALSRLPDLSGEVMSEDGQAREVTGADFWKAGPEGVASQWTGDAGRKRLAIRVQALLPRASAALDI